ncbi:sulfatase-like hydrolase/transferase [candidate division KSB1 bacterium]|nr:sulfatase-like hydrolase/transferase [candidate division KSB1 bacterium]
MPQKPNILLIHADQHRFDCLGAYGNIDIRTPNIDSLAADGVVFENSFCPYPICTPSRYSLLTGLYVHQHLGFTNRSTIPAGFPTLPRQLKPQGYKTAAVGKMHFTPTYLDVGFDSMFLAEQCGAGRYDDDYHRWLQSEGLCDRIDLIDQEAEFRKDAPPEYWQTFGAMPSNLDESHHSTTWIGNHAVEVIHDWEQGGNFLMVGFIKPHHPFDPPVPWDRMYHPGELTLLPGWTEKLIHGDDGSGYFPFGELSETQLRRVMALYYASISQIDFHVGKMIERLEDKGLYDRTIIVYTSDHGEYLGYHHRLLKAYRMLEPLVRIPLIIKFAGKGNSGGRDARLVNNVDVAPTLLSAAGISIPETMTGLDLTDACAENDYVFAEDSKEYMVRSKTRKLLLHRDLQQSMFFDLTRDATEMNNLYTHRAHQEEIRQYRDVLLEWILFRNRATNHLDMAAPQCRAQNVPKEAGKLYAYFKKQMA